MAETLGTRLRQARERKGWTLLEVSEAAGVDKSILSRIESGDRLDFRVSTAVAICHALDISLDELTGLDSDVPSRMIHDLASLEKTLRDTADQIRRALRNKRPK